MTHRTPPTKQEYTVKEALNSVLNTAKDALKVDIDNATINSGALEINLDNSNDDVLVYGSDGGTNRAIKTDNAGIVQVDVNSAPTTTITQNTHDNLNANANLQVGDSDVAAGNPVPVSGTFYPATQPVSGTVTADAGSGTMAVSNSGLTDLEGAINSSKVDVNIASGGFNGAVTGTFWPAIQPVSGTVTADAGSGSFTVAQSTASNLNATVEGTVTADAGSGSFTVAQSTAGNLNMTEANSSDIKTNLDTMVYSDGLEINFNGGGGGLSDSGDLSGSPYYALYVGTGGDLRINTGGSGNGSDLTLKNLASGQFVPIMFYRAYSTSTTSEDIVAIK